MKLNPTLIDDFTTYYVNNGYKNYTVQKFEYTITQFFKYLAKRKIKSVSRITIPIIEEYKTELKTTPIPKTSRYYGTKTTLASRTIAEKIQIIKNFFIFLNKKYDYGLDSTKIVIPKSKSQRMDYFTLEEIKQMIHAIDSMNDYKINKIRLKLLITMGFTTGMRLAELLQVTVPDIMRGTTTIIGK